MNKKLFIIVGVAVVMIGISIFFSYDIYQSTSQDYSVKISLISWAGYAHSYIAQEKGFFGDEGVNVELYLTDTTQDQIQTFKDGEVDGLFVLQSDAMLLTSQGLPLKIVYISDFSKGGDVLVSKLDIKTIADLKGKKIGVNALDGFDHYFLLYLLKQNGLDVSDVKLIEIPAHEVLDALESGIIDAGQVWEPYQSQIIASGYRLLASSADAPVAITDVLIFHAKFVEERPEDVKKVVKALFRALEFRDNNEIESYKIMSEALAVSPSSLKVTIEGNVFPNLEENKAAFSRSDQPTSLYNTGEVITNFFIEKGVYDEPINVDKILATEIINEITMEG